LGWSHGDKEFFTTEEMIEAFDLPQVGRSPSRFDFAKLENMNGHYMRAACDEDLLRALIDSLPYLRGGDLLSAKLDERMLEKLRAAMPGLKERAKTLVELLDGARFLYAERPLDLDEKAAEVLDRGGRAHIAALTHELASLPSWTPAATEAVVRAYADRAGVKLGQAAQPLRAALTGRTVSPGVFDVLNVLGREESIARLLDQSQAS
jgi:glutamyl-tRNA synthetase